jgi:hypothetical protein
VFLGRWVFCVCFRAAHCRFLTVVGLTHPLRLYRYGYLLCKGKLSSRTGHPETIAVTNSPCVVLRHFGMI